jgi:hypothetical protein
VRKITYIFCKAVYDGESFGRNKIFIYIYTPKIWALDHFQKWNCITLCELDLQPPRYISGTSWMHMYKRKTFFTESEEY